MFHCFSSIWACTLSIQNVLRWGNLCDGLVLCLIFWKTHNWTCVYWMSLANLPTATPCEYSIWQTCSASTSVLSLVGSTSRITHLFHEYKILHLQQCLTSNLWVQVWVQVILTSVPKQIPTTYYRFGLWLQVVLDSSYELLSLKGFVILASLIIKFSSVVLCPQFHCDVLNT